MLPSKYRVSVNLSVDEYTLLSQISREEGLSKAWIGKRAIAQFLTEYQDKTSSHPFFLNEQHRNGGIKT